MGLKLNVVWFEDDFWFLFSFAAKIVRCKLYIVDGAEIRGSHGQVAGGLQ